MTIKVLVLKDCEYNQSITIQKELQKEVMSNANKAFIFIVEYKNHIFTQGKYGKSENILIDKNMLERMNIKIYQTDRGGDVTYHGPGQIVCYPILNLKSLKLTVKKYIFLLEELIQTYLSEFNIESRRICDKPGIWIGDKKIASIGVNIKKFVTKHGFSINANSETKYNDYINPCGFNNLKFTSVKQITGKDISFEQSLNLLLSNFENVFNINLDSGYINLNEDSLEKIAL